ncbi:Asp-tRNA(Asn)/Glu-tRNA(Gln) amidotransferase subunit GatC [archaeon]|jgi:aspartyl-tRNA(Asn)/glutamyl-tRNA(Gln) amidotransferase subunit C|nr:Asp-tRNA(Asn)/Glu-tRNA(Gln) amidotransferase subunit GatC [archaeon]MBT6823814.1 Asp-tRNA(Asn)/Glu-tRNA(Gln) amidotransferase subunit GatC [archaeon]MBT7107151.1 Asp-tRNA(Asn)/Glu-tRNA(Gln) amidotransferase subunit GatC [archaeon]MBT7297261.1 Asp-tRNA(Asn)/Glu-tRNA(Gln) amidotransferase subunit GatC [archaeon]
MPKIDQNLIKDIAKLARLNLTKKEVLQFESDFKDVLKYFEILNELDVNNTKSSFRPIEESNVTREDKIVECIDQKEALKFSKQTKDGFFIGPRTVK